MKVLFVCRSNAGRSQCAEAFFNKYSRKNTGVSAGLDVSRARTAGSPPGGRLVKVMTQYGVDVSRKKRKQLKIGMLREAGRIVVLMTKPEIKEFLPKYFKKFSDKTVFWDIGDLRHNKLKKPLIARTEKIKRLTQKLVGEIG